ncbi:MAG: class I SAM-dependent methyltransferase [Proteobacteria bacterium]|nr:class I SAM-dependent methyltransferase [Pseudomonadota bacterium]
MDAEEKEANRLRYEARYAEFGYDERTLGWTKGRHKLRYEMLLAGWPDAARSVLDVGCGFGDMAGYCAESGRADWRYTGLDIVPALIEEGRRRRPDADLRLRDMDADGLPEGYDLVVASGVFSHRLKDNMAFIAAAFERFAAAARVGFAANFMSPAADIRYDNLFYPDPGEVLALARRHSKRAVLRHDYMPFEYTLQVFVDDGFSPDSVVFEPFEGFIDRSS